MLAAAPEVVRDLASLAGRVSGWRRAGLRVALVPTMGALHAGHLALVAAVRGAADRVVTSIFVNPLQFGSGEDLDRYPRDEAGDLAKLGGAGCDLAWLPTPAQMYPAGACTAVEPGGPALGWEGDVRPGHFRGVATVCTKLFSATGADVAVFGEKDWQQLQVVRRVVEDLCLPVRILPVPTVRDADGLPLSSRNARLTPAERARAAVFSSVLKRTATAIAASSQPGPAVADGLDGLSAAGFRPDYLALVDPVSLRPWQAGPGRLIAAARLGDVRLLDNLAVPAPSPVPEHHP